MLTADALEVSRAGRPLIAGLDLSLGHGESALVVGPNGSGKTSLLRVVAGLSPPAAGAIRWRGRSVHLLEPEQREEIAYRGHLDGLKRELTIAENLEFYAALTHSSVDVAMLLEELGIEVVADSYVRHLSAGQRRRAALAALKLSGAALWILDEPLTNLDPAGRALVAGWVRTHLENGGLAIVATHQPDELKASGQLMIEL